MQVTIDIDPGSYVIHAYRAGEIVVAPPPDGARVPGASPPPRRRTLRHSLVLLPDRMIDDWPPQTYDDLAPGHFAQLTEYPFEILLFGSGPRLRWPETALLAPLIEAGVGVEVMDTGAACRTFNILAADRRRVAAALLLG